jgi:hypothetical protein
MMRANRRLVVVVVALVVMVGAGVAVGGLPGAGGRGLPAASAPPTTSLLVSSLPSPLRMLPVDQADADGTRDQFLQATGAAQVGVVHAEVPGGDAPSGITVVSMVMPHPVDSVAGQQMLVDAISKVAPLRGATQQTELGRPAWVALGDPILASSVLVFDGGRVLFVYGGTSLEEQTVLSVLLGGPATSS